ncbi:MULTISPECIES: flagellin [unclassified Rhodanobacter]|uniref:flagellin N-terminal helical domain-containing protein n=1 Tax=unclassified Rhodanobacter TaxID=2621553 RepID=UPI001BE0FF21|nr:MULTISPECIES: flagellin [unclassified Rhodanobacter]MBT2145250.1 flagellin [Rhodanobacter sp. LX-99]MBT2149295.1 flagellin [Rhodanobacter sp. LX-100]
MVMSVITNISSLNAQKNLATSQSKLATAISRLSSGMRINSAKDDAAGLAISTRFTTQINGLNQAVSNANDGISLAQTTESALNEVTNNMQRIRTLAVQSANATNSDSDRAALDAEVQQRLSEITRISQQTTFNGRHVLDGTFGSAAFQIGANVGETISVNLSQGAGAKQVGQMATSATGDISSLFLSGASAATASVATVNGVAGFDYSTTSKAFTVDGNAVSLNAAYGTQAAMVTAVQGQLNAAAAGKYTVAASGANGFTITTTATGASSAMTIGGADAAFVNSNVAGADAVAGTPANLTLAAGDLTIDGTDMAGSYKDAQSLVDAINSKGIAGVSAYYDSGSKEMHLNAQAALTVNGAKAAAGAGNLGFSGAGATAIAIGGDLASSNVKTVSGANDTISRIDAALGTISSMRSDLGAVQNRFDSTIANLQTISQNLSSSRSQIQDADFAAETANMSSANILQQAGVSVLAQANASTQSVLKLLQ